MGVNLQPVGLQQLANPESAVVPPPDRAGRYRIEFGKSRPVPALPSSSCHCAGQVSQALLWLSFVEKGREAPPELSDVICSRCEPARYRRARRWASLPATACLR